MLRNVIIASESKITASVLQHSLLILRNMMLISTLPVQMLVFSADLCGLFSLLGTISKPHSIHSLPAYLLNRYVNQLPPLAADAPHSPPGSALWILKWRGNDWFVTRTDSIAGTTEYILP